MMKRDFTASFAQSFRTAATAALRQLIDTVSQVEPGNRARVRTLIRREMKGMVKKIVAEAGERQARITEEIARSRVTQSPWIENRERKYGSFE